MKHPNTLIIPDTHLPFTHRDFLDFCVDTGRAYGCKRVCHVGDVGDFHSISFHDSDPDGMSGGAELSALKKALRPWVKAFPVVFAALGNHDALAMRKAYANGIPSAYMRGFNEVLGLPAKWRFDFEWVFRDRHTWRLTHGTGSSGHDAAFKVAVSHRISTAQGHIHTAAGVKFHASSKDILWGMQVGCGIDRRAYAFNYGRDFPSKPILSCGVVLEGGTLPLVVPMAL